jgi:DHA1 family tetracycline resistance protein-like MFS transporter
LLLLAIFGLGVDFLLHALAPTMGWLFVGRLLAGVCGASWVIANAFIADITEPQDRGRAYGQMGAAFGLGFIIGPAVGGLLGELGPRVPFYAAAAVSGVNLIYGFFVLPETLALEHRRAFDWRRANPFGAFKVFRSYPGVVPLCTVMALFFFFTSVYPALWPFWGKANFGWSEAMVGLTLAVFGLVMAGFQGFLTGPAVGRWGEQKVVMIGLISAVIAMFGYSVVGSLVLVIGLMIVHGPEGFVHPILTAILSQRVPENAQGELQGGISAITNVAMLLGTVFFAQVFGYFMREDAPIQSPNVAFVLGGIGLVGTGLFMLSVLKKERRAGQQDG